MLFYRMGTSKHVCKQHNKAHVCIISTMWMPVVHGCAGHGHVFHPHYWVVSRLHALHKIASLYYSLVTGAATGAIRLPPPFFFLTTLNFLLKCLHLPQVWSETPFIRSVGEVTLCALFSARFMVECFYLKISLLTKTMKTPYSISNKWFK